MYARTFTLSIERIFYCQQASVNLSARARRREKKESETPRTARSVGKLSQMNGIVARTFPLESRMHSCHVYTGIDKIRSTDRNTRMVPAKGL